MWRIVDLGFTEVYHTPVLARRSQHKNKFLLNPDWSFKEAAWCFLVPRSRDFSWQDIISTSDTCALQTSMGSCVFFLSFCFVPGGYWCEELSLTSELVLLSLWPVTNQPGYYAGIDRKAGSLSVKSAPGNSLPFFDAAARSYRLRSQPIMRSQTAGDASIFFLQLPRRYRRWHISPPTLL